MPSPQPDDLLLERPGSMRVDYALNPCYLPIHNSQIRRKIVFGCPVRNLLIGCLLSCRTKEVSALYPRHRATSGYSADLVVCAPTRRVNLACPSSQIGLRPSRRWLSDPNLQRDLSSRLDVYHYIGLTGWGTFYRSRYGTTWMK